MATASWTDTIVEPPLIGGHSTIELLRAYDWASTELGPLEDWSPTYRTLTKAIISSTYAAAMFMGEQGHIVYNDAYSQVALAKHPRIFGMPIWTAWPEAYDSAFPHYNRARAGAAAKLDSTLFLLDRGVLAREQCYFSVSYVPIYDDSRHLCGIFNQVHDVTTSVLNERWNVILSQTVAACMSSGDISALGQAIMKVIQDYAAIDIPFATLFTTDFPASDSAFRDPVGMVFQDSQVWLEQVLSQPERLPKIVQVGHLVTQQVNATPVSQAVVCPLVLNDSSKDILGVTILGTNPTQPLTGQYRRFLDTFNRHITNALAELRRRDEFKNAAQLRKTLLLQELEVLRRAESRMVRMAQISPAGLYIADADGKLTYANHSWTSFMGSSFEQCVDALHPDYRPALTDAWSKLIANGTPIRNLEMRLLAQNLDGLSRWTSLNSVPEYDLSGNMVQIYGALLDISLQKSAETAAKDSNRLKSEFLANTSHEIRTPIAGVMGMAELLMDTEGLSAQQKDYVMTIFRSASSLLGTINQLLDYSKMESGHMEVEDVPFNLRRVIADTEEMLSHAFRRKGLKWIREDHLRYAGAVMGDPGKLRQILTNFVSNAIKFTKEGSVTLRIIEESDYDNVLQVRFSVQDTGIGLSKSAIQRLFKPFSQADSSMSRLYGGTGLGLSICKSLVELMQGSISLESEPGKGTTISALLPMRKSQETDPDRLNLGGITALRTAAGTPELDMALDGRQDPATPDALQTMQSHEPWVLVAEDNAIMQTIALKNLQKMGYQAVAVSNGKEAVEEALRKRYDLILMDCQMPEMDGYEATRQIRARANDGERRTPIVALTASAIRGDRDRCISSGMDDYLAKPVKSLHLQAMISKWLGTHNKSDSESVKSDTSQERS